MSFRDITGLISKGSVPEVVLLWGDEVYLIDAALKAIRQKYVDESFESMNCMEFERIEQDFSGFYEYVTTFPFMADKKICIVKEAAFLTSGGSLPKDEEDKLVALMEAGYESCITIFVIKNGKPDMRKKTVKAIKKLNGIFDIVKIDEQELTKYMCDGMKKRGFTISMGDANYMANNTGYLEYESLVSLYEVNNEMDKLASYCLGNETVLRSDIDAVVIKSVESNIFKLVDYICEGRKDRASEILDEMLLNNTPEPFIVHMIIRQYRMIYQYALLTRKGYTMNDIMTKMKIKKFVASKLSKMARSLSTDKLELYMAKLLDTDRKIKTGEIDKRIGLEILTNGMA